MVKDANRMKKEKRTINAISLIAILAFISTAIAMLSKGNAAGYIFIILAALCYVVLIANR